MLHQGLTQQTHVKALTQVETAPRTDSPGSTPEMRAGAAPSRSNPNPAGARFITTCTEALSNFPAAQVKTRIAQVVMESASKSKSCSFQLLQTRRSIMSGTSLRITHPDTAVGPEPQTCIIICNNLSKYTPLQNRIISSATCKQQLIEGVERQVSKSTPMMLATSGILQLKIFLETGLKSSSKSFMFGQSCHSDN